MASLTVGVISIIIFYDLILIAGLWAARKIGFRFKNIKAEEVMLANRSIGWVTGMFSLSAAWLGSGYTHVVAQIVAYEGGLVWCLAPVGCGICSIFGVMFFADKMRDSGSITMLDPIQRKYGDIVSLIFCLAVFYGDIVITTATLSSLGDVLQLALDMNLDEAIFISATASCVYTFLGGLYPVVYCNVIQFLCMFFGLWLCVPFALTHDAVGPLTGNHTQTWIGEVLPATIGNFIENCLILIFGTIPWQVVLQRLLAVKTSRMAKVLGISVAFWCLIVALPAALLGIAAVATDWSATEYGNAEVSDEDKSYILTVVIKYLCPYVVSVIGFGSVSAAIMSATDSAILSSSTLFARNIFAAIYLRIRKVKASETVQVWVMRISQIIFTALICLFVIAGIRHNALWYLYNDLVYVVIFPQLLCVLYIRSTNSYGSLAALLVGVVLRLLSGDAPLKIAAVIKYPWYNEMNLNGLFPYRTLAMLISLFTLVVVSMTADFLFTRKIIPLSMDVYYCFHNMPGSRKKHRSKKRVRKRPVTDMIAHREAVPDKADTPTG